MRTKHFFNLLFMAVCMTVCMACDDDNDCDYTAGPVTPADCMGVYFLADNPTETIFEPGKEENVVLTLSRKACTEKAEVPLVVTADTGLSIPTFASFEAGDSLSTVTIRLEQLQESKPYNFKIDVAEPYADHYAAVAGTTSFSGSIMVASWNTITPELNMSWTTLGMTNTHTATLKQLGNTTRYKIENFLESGIDLLFLIEDESSVMKGYACIHAYANYERYEGSEAKAFYLLDDATGSYGPWTIANGKIEIDYLCILEDYYGSGTGYSYISLDKKYGVITPYMTAYTDGSTDYYNYITFNWK